MGALNPLFLAAAVAVGIPIFLHLFQRHEARRIAFPALRYLARTEREHAKRIRSRQLLLLLVRIAILLALVGAGAGVFLRGRGEAHPPTAVAIVVDNSMSSGLVSGDERTLDRLKTLASRTLELAAESDRIWVIEAGRPWATALPGGPADARRALAAVEVTDARGDLSAVLSRAADLVRTSGMEHQEVHLLSDLQATAFGAESAPAGAVPVVVYADPAERPANRGIVDVLVGGGLPPLQGQRSEVTARGTSSDPADTVPVAVRVVVDERVRGAGTLPPGAALALPLPPAQAGWVSGYVDQDPDALRADDRRWFVYRARPAPTVGVGGDPGLFTTEALSVLEDAGRVVPADPASADVVVSGGGEGIEQVRPGRAVLLVPPGDPTRLPALNRRLADEGIPWRVERRIEPGEADVEGLEIPEPLEGVRVRAAYRLELAGDPPAPTSTLAEAAGLPWLVEGSDARDRRYLLVASPLDATSTSLPVSAEMVRFLDWVVGQWAEAGGVTPERVAGEPLSAPRPADRVVLPSGDTIPLDGTRMVVGTEDAGLYAFLSGDSLVAMEAVNPAAPESDLTPVDPRTLEDRVGADVTVVRREGAWDGEIFRARRGPGLVRPFLVAALLLLLAEAFLAAAGPGATGARPGATTGEAVRGAL